MKVYGQILRTPHLAVLIGAALLTRFPFAINGLAILLYLRQETGSFGSAGLVAGALALGAAAGSPFGSRLVDRRGARMLVPLALVSVTALLSIWALGAAGAPVPALAAVAFLTGATYPSAGAVLRSRYRELLADDGLVHGAYALDSVTIEIAFVTGPLVTAVIVALVGPEYALALSAALMLCGTLLFVEQLPGAGGAHPAAHHHSGALGPLRDPAFLMIAAVTFPVGFCIGTVEVAIPAFADQQGDAALAGVLLATWSAASAAGGLIYGSRGAERPRLQSFLLLGALLPLACLPLVTASTTWLMALLVIVAGLPIAPLIASRNLLVGLLAPDGTGAESFTWLMTALVSGLSAGTALGGGLTEAESWEAAVLLGCVVGGLGAVMAYGLRGALRPRLATS